MKHAKTINIANVHDQLIWTYNVIVFELTKNINFSKKIISVSIFFKQLDYKREIWFRIYIRKFNKNSFEYEYQSFFKYQNFNFYFKYDQKNDRKIYKSNQKQPQIVERQKRLLFAFSNEKFNENSQISDRINDDKNVFFWTETEYSKSERWIILISSTSKKLQFRKKKNYRNEYISNNYDRKNRKTNYIRDRWQNRSENRKQYQKTYANEKRFYEKKFEFFESYENINSNEKFDEEKSSKLYSYNFHSKLSNVCKKCDKSKKNIFFQ